MAAVLGLLASNRRCQVTQFSPDTLEERSYRVLRLYRSTRYEIVRYAQTPPTRSRIVAYWYDHGHLAPPSGVVRWWNVRIDDPAISYASLPHPLVEFEGAKGEAWISWSERHPDRARVVWAAVIRWMRQGMIYDPRRLRRLLERAEADDDAAALQRVIDGIEAPSLADRPVTPRSAAGSGRGPAPAGTASPGPAVPSP